MDSKYVASGDEAGVVQVHKLQNDDGAEFATKVEVEGGKPVTNILFHPDGHSVFVSTTGPDVLEYNTTSAEKMKEFKGEAEEQITALAFSNCNAAYAQRIAEYQDAIARANEADAENAVEADAQNAVEGAAEEIKELFN